MVNDPVFNRDDRYFLSDDEAFDAAAKKAVHSIQLQKKMGISNRAERYYFITYVLTHTYTSPHSLSLSPSLSHRAVDEELPTGLNETMFIPTLEVTFHPTLNCIWHQCHPPPTTSLSS